MAAVKASLAGYKQKRGIIMHGEKKIIASGVGMACRWRHRVVRQQILTSVTNWP